MTRSYKFNDIEFLMRWRDKTVVTIVCRVARELYCVIVVRWSSYSWPGSQVIHDIRDIERYRDVWRRVWELEALAWEDQGLGLPAAKGDPHQQPVTVRGTAWWRVSVAFPADQDESRQVCDAAWNEASLRSMVVQAYEVIMTVLAVSNKAGVNYFA